MTHPRTARMTDVDVGAARRALAQVLALVLPLVPVALVAAASALLLV